MHTAPTLPPDLTICWTPEGLFARPTVDETAPNPTIWWFLAAFWAWLSAIPVGMAMGSSTVTLLLAVFGAFASWRTLVAAPRAFDLRDDTITFRGFERSRVPLHRIARVWIDRERLLVELDDGAAYWLCVANWSRGARVWGQSIIEQAASRGRRLRELDVPMEAKARSSLAQLRSRHRSSRRLRE